MVAIETITGAIMTAGEIAKAIKSMADVIPKAADELTDKFRWMTLGIRNETQFKLTHTSSWFDSGRFWDSPPGIIKPFESAEFSVCSKDGSIGTGVSGGIRLEVDLEEMDETLFVGVGFAHPAVGTRKSSVIFHAKPGSVARDAHEAITADTMRSNSRDLIGINRHGDRVEFDFLAVSSPGQGTMVTITQRIK